LEIDCRGHAYAWSRYFLDKIARVLLATTAPLILDDFTGVFDG
jgi:hypothetical protein